MRRQVVMGAAVGLAAIVGIGGLVFATQQGLFGGKAGRWLALASQAQQHGNLPEAQAHLEDLVNTFPDSPLVDDALLKRYVACADALVLPSFLC